VTLPRALGVGAVMLVALAARLPAQTTAAEMLQRAIQAYENVEIEDALAILRQIVSPSAPAPVSVEQRVQAYKFLGAVFALQPGAENHDSAVTYFSAALGQDPSVDLDPKSFTPAQLAAFAEARNRTFALAVRTVRPDTLDSSAAMLTFRCSTSHAALLRAELRSDGVTALVLYEGPSEGSREITWDGKLPGRPLPLAGRYELVLIGRSSVVNQTDSAAVSFDLQLDHPSLEDTLPDLGPPDLLPEVDADNREIPANVAENQQRRANRAANNAAVAERNAEVLRRSKVVMTPVARGAP
jgi:hypothetical protein